MPEARDRGVRAQIPGRRGGHAAAWDLRVRELMAPWSTARRCGEDTEPTGSETSRDGDTRGGGGVLVGRCCEVFVHCSRRNNRGYARQRQESYEEY